MTQEQALNILKTGANVFLTGEPGSGKTHTINRYVAYLRAHGISPAITASTGIAATHIGGTTIHSWSGIGIKTKLCGRELDEIVNNQYVAGRINNAKILIIDEVSMLLPEVLGMIEAVCRKIRRRHESFGGLQIILVGDFFQLPPVVKTEAAAETQAKIIQTPPARFAYDAPVWAMANFLTCYLTEQHRQDDGNFFDLLSAIRRNAFGDHHLAVIKARKIFGFKAPQDVPKLFSHNADVDRINNEMLAKLPGQPERFTMFSFGRESIVAALKKGCLSPEMLFLKVGAVVMFTKNNQREGFVNGTLGTVAEFDEDNGQPIVRTRNGRKIKVEPMDWTVEDNGQIRARITQLPLRLAWAMTVHKSQGMSLDEAVMDLSQVFEFGQGYVALSRVKRLSGLHLLGWNERAFQVHPEILAKDESFRAASKEAEARFSEMFSVELHMVQNNFVSACGGTPEPVASENYHSRKKKPDTHRETLVLWKEGKTISEIAKERGLKEQTIFSHIERLVLGKKINPLDIFRLLTPSLSRALPKIHATFRELNTTTLSLVFEHLDGMHSYDELRIARMMLGEREN